VLLPRLDTTGIDSLEDLRDHLQTALQLEHATIPPYFTAWLSVNENKNPDTAEVIRTVMLEEMLHLTLAANLLNAVGGEPKLADANRIPDYPARLPHCGRDFEVSIERFSSEALNVFLKIELPEAPDAEPQPGEYRTIGQFYSAIAQGIERLCEDLGEDQVFTGKLDRQLRPEDYYGSGALVVVRDKQSALAAIREIKEQGEGADQTPFDLDRVVVGDGPGSEPAHYFRFLELKLGKRFRNGDTLRTGPTGKSISTEIGTVYPIAKNPRPSNYPPDSPARLALAGFADTYMTLLISLENAFNGHRDELTSAMARMFSLKNAAMALLRTPGPGEPNTTLGLAFKR
jgi:hypothetical protein